MTITKIPAGRMRGNIGQGFGVEIMYPGLSLTTDDSGIGPIGRIDRAQVQPGHLIGMHPHKDDENTDLHARRRDAAPRHRRKREKARQDTFHDDERRPSLPA
ncbi:hypothetical protein [Rhizobium sp. Root491]|uniref:hypothetical protein n=1 Tax=Rhizobium sp. Root491 TaxID=1736548 RepID=UPI002B23E035|nr:hypothetical protein [Rhizobium sp. Root491]